MQDAKHCTRCDGPLEPGFLEELQHGFANPSYWIKGQKKKTRMMGWTIDIEDRREIAAYRCTSCGHLDLFAP